MMIDLLWSTNGQIYIPSSLTDSYHSPNSMVYQNIVFYSKIIPAMKNTIICLFYKLCISNFIIKIKVINCLSVSLPGGVRFPL